MRSVAAGGAAAAVGAPGVDFALRNLVSSFGGVEWAAAAGMAPVARAVTAAAAP